MSLLIKQIFSDILRMYNNFLHFNLSKILIYLTTFVLSFIFALPIAIIAIILFFAFWLWDLILGLEILLANPILIVIGVILSILFIFALSLGYSYKSILLFRLNLWYIDDKKLAYKKNDYFNFSLIYNYTKIFLLNLVILLIPIIIFIVFFFILLAIFWGYSEASSLVSEWPTNILSISFLVLSILCLGLFIYLTYKMLFAYVIFADESKDNKFENAFYYIRKSFFITKWFKKAGKFIFIFLLTLIIALPIYTPKWLYSDEIERKIDYLNVEYGDNKKILEEQPYYFQTLKLEYGNISLEKLEKDISLDKKIIFLLSVLEFLFVVWLFNMMIASFYVRELKWNKKILNGKSIRSWFKNIYKKKEL